MTGGWRRDWGAVGPLPSLTSLVAAVGEPVCWEALRWRARPWGSASGGSSETARMDQGKGRNPALGDFMVSSWCYCVFSFLSLLCVLTFFITNKSGSLPLPSFGKGEIDSVLPSAGRECLKWGSTSKLSILPRCKRCMLCLCAEAEQLRTSFEKNQLL